MTRWFALDKSAILMWGYKSITVSEATFIKQVVLEVIGSPARRRSDRTSEYRLELINGVRSSLPVHRQI